MEHKGTKILETERLLLRPWREADAQEAFDNWMNDPEVTRYLTWAPHGSVNVTRFLLREWERQSREADCYHWAMVLRKTGELIGDISIMHADAYQESGTVGYCMGRAWWGRGLMTEAFREVLRYCFEEVGFERVTGGHAAENIGSSRVMEKCGLRREGLRRAHFRLLTGPRVDIVDRGILREEYFADKAINRENYSNPTK